MKALPLLFAAGLLAVGATAHFVASPQLVASETYVSGVGNSSGLTLFAPHTRLQASGDPLADVLLSTQEECAAACERRDSCQWFHYCGTQVRLFMRML